MTYTPQEIYDALNIIKTTCVEQGCSKCPFYMQDSCMIVCSDLSPCEWELNSPSNWVAFH